MEGGRAAEQRTSATDEVGGSVDGGGRAVVPELDVPAEFNAESLLSILPHEALLKVLRMLKPEDLLRLGLVCRAALLMSEDDSLWPPTARRRTFFRKWALSQQQATMMRAGSRGLCGGVVALQQAVLVAEEGDRLSILSLLNDRLTELPLVGKVDKFDAQGSVLVAIVILASGTADERREGYLYDLSRPGTRYLLDGQESIGPAYFNSLTCVSVHQQLQLVAFGHRDGRVDCFRFGPLPRTDENASSSSVISLAREPAVFRPQGRACVSTVQIVSAHQREPADEEAIDNVSRPEDVVLVCGYTNGRIEICQPAAGDDERTTLNTKRFCLEEGSSITWAHADKDAILCSSRSLVALSSESLHVLERADTKQPYTEGWKRRCLIRPGKGHIVAAHSTCDLDTVVVALAHDVEVWSKTTQTMLISTTRQDDVLLSIHSVSSASSAQKDDHWLLALTTRALYLLRLCHSRGDKLSRAPRRGRPSEEVRRRTSDHLFTSWWEPYHPLFQAPSSSAGTERY